MTPTQGTREDYGEIAPGLFISGFVPQGQAFRMSRAMLDGGPGYGLAINVADWKRIPPELREKFADDMTRLDAERGARAFAAYLAAADVPEEP